MKVLIAGDYCPIGRIQNMIDHKDFSFFSEIKQVTKKHDISILNLECPIIEGPEEPISKCGPNHKTNKVAVESIKYAGFNFVTLANNHIMDYGVQGLKNTEKILHEYNIEFVGVGDNLKKASEIKYVKLENKTLAIINCCEHEFSISDDHQPGANPLNPIGQYYKINEAKEKADFIIILVHGGNEHYQLPSPRMMEIYRFFIDSGADIVINNHQHCYSGYELYNNKPIFYGIGNFCFDRESKVPESFFYGYMVSLELSNEIKFNIIPYSQCLRTPIVKLLKKDSFKEKLLELNSIISNPSLIKEKFNRYLEKNKLNIELLFEPYNNRFLKKFYKLGLLPKFNKGKKFQLLKGHIQCESHFDKIKYYLDNTF